MECTVLDLLTDGGRIAGAFGYDRERGRFKLFTAKAVVLATGGIGRAFKITSNSWEYTGDGQALAYRAGAALMDMEFVQFHPTGMVWPPSVRGILVTEGVRGEGGVLRNNEGKRFMFDDIPDNYKPQTADNEEEGWRYVTGDKNARRPPELLTRDHVARCIVREVREGRGSPHGGVFLDIAWIKEKIPNSAEHIKRKLPSMYHQFKQLADIDITEVPMEIGPTTHYVMGGVRVDGDTQMSDNGGEIAVDGRLRRFHGPRDAIAAGIITIPQELRLVPALSLAENLTLGDPPQRCVLGVTVVDRARMRHEAREQLAQLDFAPDPDRRVDQLSFAERQLVAIAKALRRECRVLILDEPTAALETREIERLFAVLTRMKENGTAIVYVSHRLDEVVALADRCTVLRDGRIAATSRRGDFKVVDLVAAMTGGAAAKIETEALVPGAVILEDIADRPDATRLHAREVTGLAGLLGSGASAVLRRLFGVGSETTDVRRDGAVRRIASPAAAVRSGIGFLPGERQLGLIMNLRSATTFCCQASTVWHAAAMAESIAGVATFWSDN